MCNLFEVYTHDNETQNQNAQNPQTEKKTTYAHARIRNSIAAAIARPHIPLNSNQPPSFNLATLIFFVFKRQIEPLCCARHGALSIFFFFFLLSAETANVFLMHVAPRGWYDGAYF